MDKFEAFEKEMIDEVIQEEKETNFIVYAPRVILVLFTLIAAFIIWLLDLF